MSLASAPTTGTYWHYRAYDVDGRLLYLGVTGNPEQRMRAHRSGAAWFRHVVRIDWRDAGPNRMAALRAEAAAILAERPVYATTPGEVWERRQMARAAAHAAGRFCNNAGCAECKRERRAGRRLALEVSA